MHISFYFLIFVISWQSVFRLSDWATLPIVSLLFCTILTCSYKTLECISQNVTRLHFKAQDTLILCAFFFLILNALAQPNAKSANYLLAYFVVFGSSLLIIWLLTLDVFTSKLLRVNYYSVNFIIIILYAEVFSKFVFGNNITEWLPRHHEATATVATGVRRGYALASEPTQVGNYLCSFAPLALYYVFVHHRKFFMVYSALIILGGFLTFSSTFAVVLVGMLTCFLILSSERRLIVRFLIKYCVFLLFAFIFIVFYFDIGEIIYDVYDTIVGKISLDVRYKSVDQRLNLLQRGIDDVIRYPFGGTGLGFAGSQGLPSNVNWYLFLASEVGIFTAGLFVLWISSHLILAVILYSRTHHAIYLIFAVMITGSMLYLAFLSQFQNLFLLCVIIIFRIHLNSRKSLSLST